MTSTRTVRIITEATGTNFGFVGFVNARNNRTIKSTHVFSNRDAAMQAASDLASREGWTVESAR